MSATWHLDPELYEDEPASPWLGLIKAILVIVLGAMFALLVGAYILESSGSKVTQIKESPTVVNELDPASLPDVYTGQQVDIDRDGTADVAVFGDPKAPVLRPLKTEGSWLSQNTGALLVAGVGVGGTLAAAVIQPWAQARWPRSKHSGQ